MLGKQSSCAQLLALNGEHEYFVAVSDGVSTLSAEVPTHL
jgi:hypothetical protein